MRRLIRHLFDAVAVRLAHRIAAALPRTSYFEELQALIRAADERHSAQIDAMNIASAFDQEQFANSLKAIKNNDDLLTILSGKLDYVSNGQTMLRHSFNAASERALLLSGRSAALQVQERDKIAHLGDVEFRVTSQWGEDGIIEWLCHKLPNIPRSFVEFGVESFSEANTRFLLQNRGWKGIVIDADRVYMDTLRSNEMYWRHDITAVTAFVSVENINELIFENGLSGEIGILSVDIDGNDYWMLKAIDVVSPAIIICEINGIFGDNRAITIPYIGDFSRFSYHYSGGYYGCSIRAAMELCRERGYSFIGTSTSGVNAFFVRNDLAPVILDSIGDLRIWSQRHRDSRDSQGNLVFLRAVDKLALIQDMPVVDLDTGNTVLLKDLMPLHSEALLRDP